MRRALIGIVLCLAPAPARPQGEPLGPEFRVNTYTTHMQEAPVAAADGAGNFVVVWQSQSQDGSGYGIFGKRYDSSGTPRGGCDAGEFRVNTATVSDQKNPTSWWSGRARARAMTRASSASGTTAQGRPRVASSS
jgi:hypothetical protein